MFDSATEGVTDYKFRYCQRAKERVIGLALTLQHPVSPSDPFRVCTLQQITSFNQALLNHDYV